jgi:hypothetical protein
VSLAFILILTVCVILWRWNPRRPPGQLTAAQNRQLAFGEFWRMVVTVVIFAGLLWYWTSTGQLNESINKINAQLEANK